MGYANVFWINEEPIRAYLNANGKDDNIIELLGEAVLSLTCSDSFQDWGNSPSVGLLNKPSVISSVGSFHSTDFLLLIWTGAKLIKFPNLELNDYLCLEKLDQLSTSDNYLSPLSSKQRQSEVDLYNHLAEYTRSNLLESSGKFSIYWMYEDFSRDYIKVPKEQRPNKEVGEAVFQLMLDTWNRSVSIRNAGNPLSKVGSYLESEFGVFIWSLNCLRKLSDIDNEEREKIIEWLSRE